MAALTWMSPNHWLVAARNNRSATQPTLGCAKNLAEQSRGASKLIQQGTAQWQNTQVAVLTVKADSQTLYQTPGDLVHKKSHLMIFVSVLSSLWAQVSSCTDKHPYFHTGHLQSGCRMKFRRLASISECIFLAVRALVQMSDRWAQAKA